MTTLLPTQDLALMRALARTAGVLLVAVRINQLHPGRAISDYEIADILEVDKRTVQKQLRSLSAAGLMLEQRPGKYVVTAAGQNTLLNWSDQPQIAETTSLSIEEQPVYSDAQNVQFMIDDDIKNLNHDSSSSINPESTKCAQILESTQILFGESVSTACLSDIAHPKPTWVLAWVNKAWRDRERLTNPHGLIYRRVISCERPPLWLEKDPTAGLPEEFLEAIGMLEKACPRCHENFTSRAEHTVHVEKCIMTHFEEPEVEAVVDTRDQIWRHIVNQLPEIKGIVFHASEKTTMEGNTLVVYLKELRRGERAEYANQQVAPLASKIYAEITGNKDAKVKFVSVETE